MVNDMKFQTMMNGSQQPVDLTSWDRVLEHCVEGSSEIPISTNNPNSGTNVLDDGAHNVDSYDQDFWQVTVLLSVVLSECKYVLDYQ